MAALSASAATHHRCLPCDQAWGRHHHWHPPPTEGPLQHHVATHYSGPCDGQSNHLADGTLILGDGSLSHYGKHADDHVLASSFISTGTHVRFTRRVYGARDWIVRDSGGSFDLYRPNCDFSGWPGSENPDLFYRLVK